MKFASNLEWSRKAFEIFWRLSLLALPWQSRFFWDAQLAGWPWEQGRTSVYLSWFPILITILLGFFQVKKDLPFKLRQNLFWLVALLAACSVLALRSPNAAVQWWLQIMLLATFFITLIRTDVAVRKIIFWFAVSIVPHALLAVLQFSTQSVVGSSWLGMASQNPADLGVSVVQTSFGRFLRAYGGFPHPNILGGWMALGLLTTIWLPQPSLVVREGARRAGELFLVGLFTLGLFYSFSRSAWLAAAAGLAVFALLSFLRRQESRKINLNQSDGSPPSVLNLRGDDKKRWFYFVIPIILFATLTTVHRDLVFTRLQTTSRLEQKSIVTRLQTLKDGIEVFQSRLLFGTGPNSELPVLASLKKHQIEEDSIRIAAIGQFIGNYNFSWNADEYVHSSMAAIGPLEPPHMVWLLILVNFGIAGTIAIFGFGIYFLLKLIKRWPSLDPQGRILMITLSSFYFLVSSLDHYPWSLWPGQVLSIYILFLIFCVKRSSIDD